MADGAVEKWKDTAVKAIILDPSALSAVSPTALRAYATSEGWARLEAFGDHSDVYVRGDARTELIIPGTTSLVDYAAVVSSLLGAISAIEGRDELELYRDLVGADHDVIRVRAPGAEPDGSIKIDDGVEVVREARDLVLAAACSATEPRATYRAGKMKEASGYMDRVRLGQTEQGSYVVTMLAPIPPALQPQAELWPALTAEPFERLVTRRLSFGLATARQIAKEAVRGRVGIEAFRDAVPSGVSANLCEALSSLIERGHGLSVSVTWARTRPAPERMSTVEYTAEEGIVLGEAARVIRTQEPRPDERLTAYVLALDRKLEAYDGRLTLKTFLDGQPTSVRTKLPKEMYEKAIAAHADKEAVVITGDLVRKGQRWHLENPRDLALVMSEGDDEDETGTN